MKRVLVTTASVLALTLGGSGAFAACNIGNETAYSDKDRAVRSAEVRQDLRVMRHSAMILKDYGKEQACEEVVEAINAVRSNQTARSGASGQPNQTAAAKDGSPGSAMTWQERSKTQMAKAVPLKEAKGRLSVSNLMGADIVGSNNDTIAEIEDVVMTPNGEASYFVVGFGGFLGLGEEQSAIPFEHLKVAYDEDGEPTFFLAMTEDELSKAPRFKRGSVDWVSDENWRMKNDKYYVESSKS